jgi:ubiquinone/menaquinone biosynthesis C-methylase UbiE
VLEIGCGAGAASCLFARGGARVTAIDLTEQGVALTRRAAEQLSLKVDARRMDAEQLEFPDRSFDLVFTWGVIHHSQHTEAIAREIARVLRPGGRALCMVYNRASLRYYVKGLAWLVLRGKALQGFGFAGVQRFFTDGYYHRHFSKGEFAALFAEAGLRLDRMSVTHMAKHMVPLVPRRIDDGLKHRYGWLLVGEFSKPAAAEAHLGGHSE